MALNINTNIASLKAQNQLNKTSQGLQKSLERLSSGLRINWAADDAAGLAIADGLRATAKGLGQAIRNANEGISLIKVADGALIEYGNILATIKEKVTQAANATQNAETRKSIQRDINKLLAELDNIARTTEFNGQKLLSGAFVNKKFQIGSASYVTASLSIRSAETNAIGGTKTSVMDLNTIGDMQLTITNAASGLSVTTEKIQLLFNNSAANGAGALANEINRYSGVTGVSAVAVVESTSEQIQAGNIQGLKINGITIGDITVQGADADGALVNAINQKSLQTGVTASVTEDGRLTLTSNDGRAIKVEAESGLSSVLGKSAQQLSTLGHIRLIQKGVADFQISGYQGSGVGGDITLNSTSTVLGESILSQNSSIASGSVLRAGTVIGGTLTEDELSTDLSVSKDMLLAAGSTLASGSVIATGTQITGNIVADADVTAEADFYVTAGSTLVSGTTIGAGTVVYGSLAEALGVDDGTVIGSGGATLNTTVTLNTDILMKYDSSNNTVIESGSTIAAGSTVGGDVTLETTATFNVAMTLKADSTIKDADGTSLAAGTKLGADVTLDSTLDTTEQTILASRSQLASGSTVKTGSVLETNSLEVASDVDLNQDTTVAKGTYLASGTTIAAGTLIQEDMTLYNGSDAISVKAGTVLDTDLTVGTGGITLTSDLTLAQGSTIKANSDLVTKPSSTLGQVETMKLSDLNVLDYESAQISLTIVEAAVSDIDGVRAELGSVQNQLESTVANISVTQVNVQAAESAIREVDFASESANFTKMQVLMQAGMFALAQSNTLPQMAVQLLQG